MVHERPINDELPLSWQTPRLNFAGWRQQSNSTMGKEYQVLHAQEALLSVIFINGKQQKKKNNK